MIKEILKTKVSWYNNISDTKSYNTVTIEEILFSIQRGGNDGKIASQIDVIRAESDIKKRRFLKGQLPVIMWQGVFKERSKLGLQSLTGIMCIDIDHKSESEIRHLKKTLCNIPWIISIFRSPSSDGLKVLVKTKVNNPADYDNCYRQLIDYFFAQFECKVDENCKDVSRACYASYDPDIYVALQIEDFPYSYDPKYEGTSNSLSKQCKPSGISYPPALNKADLFLNNLQTQVQGLSDTQIINILDKKFSRYPKNYEDGHRTQSIFSQATKLCLAGVDGRLAIEYLKGRFLPTGYTLEKLLHEAGNAYQKNSDRFGNERGQYKAYRDYVRK